MEDVEEGAGACKLFQEAEYVRAQSEALTKGESRSLQRRKTISGAETS